MLGGVWKIAAAIGAVFGMLSVVMLAKEGIDFGFVAPLRTMLDWYDALIWALLSPIAPVLEAGARLAERVFSIDLQLHRSWQHILTATLVVGGAALRGSQQPWSYILAGMMALGGVSEMFDRSFAPSALGLPPSLSMLGAIAGIALAITANQGARAMLDLARSLGVVFGGATLFVALNAGLKLAGL